jgi:5-methylcytosine-specific restriction endonuclease McrA
MHKKCSKCNQEKLLNQFYKKSSSKDGFMSCCKSCDSKRTKKYLAENKEKSQLRHKQYYELNSDKIKSTVSNYYKENKETILEHKKKYNELNKHNISQKKKIYRENNQEYFREYYENYYKLNASVYVARANKRRAAKLKALPKWLTKEELEQIKELYEIARMFKLYTGEEYHVDHIVPLQGENVCGLHVPWNLQVIPAKENLSKSNKLQEDIL